MSVFWFAHLSLWIVHEVVAWCGADPAGHLKISYIPQDRFDTRLSTMREFMRHARGWGGVLDEDPRKALVTLLLYGVRGLPSQ